MSGFSGVTPTKVVYSKAIFDELYSGTCSVPEHGESRYGYGKHYYLHNSQSYQRRAEYLIDRFSLTSRSDVIVGGAGFGYLTYWLRQARVRAVGFDNSPFIRTNYGREAMMPAPLRYHDVLAHMSRAAGNRTDLFVTESMLDTCSDAQIASLGLLGVQQCHFVDPNFSWGLFSGRDMEWWGNAVSNPVAVGEL